MNNHTEFLLFMCNWSYIHNIYIINFLESNEVETLIIILFEICIISQGGPLACEVQNKMQMQMAPWSKNRKKVSLRYWWI